MDYLNTNLKWEDFFIQESVELEEKMPGFDMDALSKSKLRLSLENNILDWKKYEAWVRENVNCASLKEDVAEGLLKNFTTNAQQALEIYSNYDFWNEDLLPVFIWDNQLIVFGLQYNENLIKIQNHIFILAKPEILSYFSKILFNKEDSNALELEALEKSYSQTVSRIEGLDADIKPPTLDFTKLSLDPEAGAGDVTAAETTQALPDLQASEKSEPDENTIWEFITERHDEYSYEVKKHFNAYVVLKINHGNTKVFKMDKDLQRRQVNEKLFEYRLSDDNPFRRVFENGHSESFSVSQLGLNLLSFKYVCITALRRGEEIVGFLVGFKENTLSENDQSLLEDLAKEAA